MWKIIENKIDILLASARACTYNTDERTDTLLFAHSVWSHSKPIINLAEHKNCKPRNQLAQLCSKVRGESKAQIQIFTFGHFFFFGHIDNVHVLNSEFGVLVGRFC